MRTGAGGWLNRMLARVGLLKPVYIRTPLAADERVRRLARIIHRRGGGTPKERRRRFRAATGKPLMGWQNQHRVLVYPRLGPRWLRARGRYLDCQPAVLELRPELTMAGKALLPSLMGFYGLLASILMLTDWRGYLGSLLRPPSLTFTSGILFFSAATSFFYHSAREHRLLVGTLRAALDGEVLPGPPESNPPVSRDGKC